MERLRFIADFVAAAQGEDADNRAARRAFFVERMAAFDPEVMAFMMGAFAGPETITDEAMAASADLIDRVRAA
jgi:hypothetical protein